ncbi:Maf family protein [Paraglaciecola sp. 2405UD69-4]|uniref:Maf family protein n=1 Tax=Paraglaciecola sp. 2405UD69-4 TaxID=3391836 RepID=UPI0039C9671C
MKFVLASSSTYRQSILKKLSIPFTAMAPDIDESLYEGETIETQVKRLAQQKACAIANKIKEPNTYIIGSDQLASINGTILGKPGDFHHAKQQLLKASGQTVQFYTGLCLVCPSKNQLETLVDVYQVSFRKLSEHQIDTYLNIEKPFDCAGSFKSEGLGIALFSSLEGTDPNSLIGLPLIRLIELFEKMSIDIFDYMEIPT